MEFLNKIKSLVDTTFKKIVAIIVAAGAVFAAIGAYMIEIADKLPK